MLISAYGERIINKIDSGKETALHYAAYWNKDIDITKILIENGSDVNS